MFSRPLVLSLAFSAALMGAEPPSTAPSAPTLSLEGAVSLALERNFDLQIQRTINATAKETLEIEKSAFDPTLKVTASKSFDSAPTSGGGSTTTHFSTTQVSASQYVATGGTITATGGLDRNRIRPTSSIYDPMYDSDVTLRISQPLLKGAGSSVAKAGVNRARLGFERSQAELKVSVLSVVRSVETAFYSLVFAREQYQVRVFSLEVAEKLLDEAKARRETGVATDIDVLQAEVGVANARRALLNAEQLVRNAEDTLSSLITPQEFGKLPEALALPPLPAEKPDLNEAIRLARLQSPEFLSASLAAEQAKVDLKVAQRNRLPDVALVAGGGYRAREDNASDATSNVWGSDRYNWDVGATVTIPWGQRADKARFRSAKNSMQAADLRVQATEQDVSVQVRTAFRAASTSFENVKISALATELSARQYELEKARYDAGVSTFRRVQESKEDYDTARINELQSQLDLRNAHAELARIEATSLAKYRITLE